MVWSRGVREWGLVGCTGVTGCKGGVPQGDVRWWKGVPWGNVGGGVLGPVVGS